MLQNGKAKISYLYSMLYFMILFSLEDAVSSTFVKGYLIIYCTYSVTMGQITDLDRYRDLLKEASERRLVCG